jgi:hypothetical protein
LIVADAATTSAGLFTLPRNRKALGEKGHENISLDVDDGYLILDVVKGQITYVEVLYLDAFRDQILRLLP